MKTDEIVWGVDDRLVRVTGHMAQSTGEGFSEGTGGRGSGWWLMFRRMGRNFSIKVSYFWHGVD